MKKRLLIFGAVLLMAGAGTIGYRSYLASQDPMQTVLKANIEALSRDESGKQRCYRGGVPMKGYSLFVCSSCSVRWDWTSSYDSEISEC